MTADDIIEVVTLLDSGLFARQDLGRRHYRGAKKLAEISAARKQEAQQAAARHEAAAVAAQEARMAAARATEAENETKQQAQLAAAVSQCWVEEEARQVLQVAKKKEAEMILQKDLSKGQQAELNKPCESAAERRLLRDEMTPQAQHAAVVGQRAEAEAQQVLQVSEEKADVDFVKEDPMEEPQAELNESAAGRQVLRAEMVNAAGRRGGAKG